jgi:hypothetical protein
MVDILDSLITGIGLGIGFSVGSIILSMTHHWVKYWW